MYMIQELQVLLTPQGQSKVIHCKSQSSMQVSKSILFIYDNLF